MTFQSGFTSTLHIARLFKFVFFFQFCISFPFGSGSHHFSNSDLRCFYKHCHQRICKHLTSSTKQIYGWKSQIFPKKLKLASKTKSQRAVVESCVSKAQYHSRIVYGYATRHSVFVCAFMCMCIGIRNRRDLYKCENCLSYLSLSPSPSLFLSLSL